jgi:hypothetical protein
MPEPKPILFRPSQPMDKEIKRLKKRYGGSRVSIVRMLVQSGINHGITVKTNR